MKILLSLEEMAQLTLAIIGLYLQPISISWWLWPFIFLSPDISMFGYAAGNRVGAFTYNLVHHKAVAIAVGLLGYFLDHPILLLAGLVLYGHSAMDRMLGYGLKYEDGFKHTHLGVMK